MVFDNFPAAHCRKLSRDNDPPWQIWCNQTCFCRFFSLRIIHPSKGIFKARKWETCTARRKLACPREKMIKLWNYCISSERGSKMPTASERKYKMSLCRHLPNGATALRWRNFNFVFSFYLEYHFLMTSTSKTDAAVKRSWYVWSCPKEERNPGRER